MKIQYKIYFLFSRIQTYRSFYFFRRLFAKHQTLSSYCWVFSSWSRWRRIRRLSISKLFFIAVIVINHWWKYSDQTRIKLLLKRLYNIGMASEKLYRNTLKSIIKRFNKSYTYSETPSFIMLHWETSTLEPSWSFFFCTAPSIRFKFSLSPV